MTAKVKSLRGGPIPEADPTPPRNTEFIAQLEEVLEKAKNGDVLMGAILFTADDGFEWWYAGVTDRIEFMGYLAQLSALLAVISDEEFDSE